MNSNWEQAHLFIWPFARRFPVSQCRASPVDSLHFLALYDLCPSLLRSLPFICLIDLLDAPIRAWGLPHTAGERS